MFHAAALALTCLAGSASAPCQDSPLERAPGVLVKIYEIGVHVAQIPDLVPGQLPNRVDVVETIDLNPQSWPYGQQNQNFVAVLTGELDVAQAGSYAFRLISDDGGRLRIAGRVIVDNDGLHAAIPKDGVADLDIGRHPFEIILHQAGGDAQVTLQWRTPGSADFTLVPADRLSHDARASKETAPGPKRIIPPLRRGLPGDGAPLTEPHPSYGPVAHSDVEPAREGTWLDRGRMRVMGETVPANDDPPAVWLPQVEGGAYHDLLHLEGEPYADDGVAWAQDVQSVRIGLDRFDEHTQGCVFRFGLTPLAIRHNGKVTFEMLRVRAMSNGLEITFTAPLYPRVGWDPACYHVEQWPFDVKAGRPPSRDGSTTAVRSASVSPDRRSVFLEIDDLRPGCVVYLRLLPPFASADGDKLWSTEAWYTLNALPADRGGTPRTPPQEPPQNVLTAEEEAAGWRLLFDGESTQGWRGFRKPDMPDGWQVQRGCLTRVGPGGDIVTTDAFESFELKLEWRISPAGNSGIFYHVSEAHDHVWRTGPEMQVLDNAEHADGRNPLTSAGANYGLIAPVRDATRPVGFFNEARIVVDGPHVEHWLNGVKLLEYELGSPAWEQLVAQSKFASMPHYGRTGAGHIALQDHGDKVWFRNIKIREIRHRVLR